MSDFSTKQTTDSDESETGRDHKSIGEVLTLLQDDFPDISISKIRFLESRGLVEPHRAPSGYRKFGSDDVERLRWILTMQRDHFLPLRVIKERLDRGDTAVGADLELEADLAVPATPAGLKSTRFREPLPDDDGLDPSELSRMAGLSAQQLDQLVQFGLLEPRDTPNGPRYSGDELRVAKAAGAFLLHGIEPRHLKAWRVAAEREAGMLEQIVVPITRKGSSNADHKAREVADELVDMGNVIREAIIVKSLRSRLGFGSD